MRKIIGLTFLALSIIACNSENKTYLITKESVGVLQKNVAVQKLDSIYAKDSLVNSTYEGELRYANTERILIFEKGGKELLEITPAISGKTNEKVVESVRILDPRFTTEKGISLASTYKDIKSKYTDFEIEQTFKSILITPKGENVYFTFDKSALKNKNFGLSSDVTKDDIEEDAKIDRMVVDWSIY
ncbi:hypothetical protein ACF3OB_00380 [Capnocytophaga canis]|uniref:hypothetical protein n=1 Tax=Capnocytophaga canis TaxID=1848903 RepID=UPI00370D093C